MNIFKLFPKRAKSIRKAEGPSRFQHMAAMLSTSAKRSCDAAAALFIFAAGSHIQETERLPKAEVRSLRVEGALVVCTTAFICAVFASAMVVAKMPVWAIIPMLALVAVFWLLIDRSLLAAFNMADGERLAERSKVPGYFPVKAFRRKLMVVGTHPVFCHGHDPCHNHGKNRDFRR